MTERIDTTADTTTDTVVPAEAVTVPPDAAPDGVVDAVPDAVAFAAVADAAAAVAPDAVPAPRRERRGLRAVLRWSVALVVLAAFGTGAAYAMTVPQRTDLPGLATPADGRWTFPALKPVGRGITRDDGYHMTDVSALLLPAPVGARPDRTLPGAHRDYPAARFAALFTSPATESQRLEQYACRHLAATGWTMPDGTRERIYLLQFNGSTAANAYRDDLTSDAQLAGSPETDPDADPDMPGRADGVPEAAAITGFRAGHAGGTAKVRLGYLTVGDTTALVIETGPHGSPHVPFLQTVALQAQLLG